jgi:hypothetical protein
MIILRINITFFELITIILVVGKLSDNLAWPWIAIWIWAILLQIFKALLKTEISTGGRKK